MDEARRQELHARREALLEEKRQQDFVRRRAEFVAMVPILAALEAAGDAYDSDSYRGLTGPLNWWACDPHRFAMREESHAELPLDRPALQAAILAVLHERLGADDLVTVIIRREGLMLTMRMPVLIRHLDIVIDDGEGGSLAFAAPPADWIVVVDRRFAIPVNEIVTGKVLEYPD